MIGGWALILGEIVETHLDAEKADESKKTGMDMEKMIDAFSEKAKSYLKSINSRKVFPELEDIANIYMAFGCQGKTSPIDRKPEKVNIPSVFESDFLTNDSLVPAFG